MKMTKKILSIILVVMMLFSVSMVATSAYTVPDGFAVADKDTSESAIDGEVYGYVGDTDMNDRVSVQDATLIQKYAADLKTLDEYQMVLADVNFDGKVNIKDATAIGKSLVNLPVDAPVGQLIYTTEPTTSETQPTTSTTQPTPAQQVTVYFINSANWANVKAYVWDNGGTPAVEWPGAAAVKTTEKVNGYDVYSYTFDAKYNNIIFNDGTNQTADLEVKAGQYFYFKDSTWYASANDVPSNENGGNEDKDTYTIYFTKPGDWADAYIYGFYGVEGGESNQNWPSDYPGAKMNFFETNEYGQDVYTYEVPKDIDYIKFSDGSVDNRRTNNVPNADLKDGRGFYITGDPVGTNKWDVAHWDTIQDETTGTTTVIDKDTYTVYFIKPANWAAAYIYGFYGVEGENADQEWPATYPGAEMTLVEGNKYSYEVPQNINYIKFTDGGTADNMRTENVKAADIADGRIYEVDFTRPTAGKANSWAVKWTDPVPDPDPTETTTTATDDEIATGDEIATKDEIEITVYFEKPASWAAAYIYGFYGVEGVEADQEWPATYPGAKMTLVEGNMYSYKVPQNINYIKFTDGGTADNMRTENVKAADIVDGRIYEVDFDRPTEGKANSWAAKWAKDEPKPDSQYVLKGSFDDWGEGYALGDNGDDTYSVTLELAAGRYEFKLVDGARWLSNTSEINDTTNGAWTFRDTVEGNAILNATGGTYTFSVYTVTENDEFKVKLAITAENIVDPNPDPDPDPEPDPDAPVVYFVNTVKWAEVAAYTYNAETLGTWPGTKMTKTGNQVHGCDVYEIRVSGSFEKIIFNNNNNGSQTENLDFVANKYYDAKGNMYSSLSEVPAPSTNVFLAGSFNSWSATANEFQLTAPDAATSVVTLELAANTTYQFKIVRDGAWTTVKDFSSPITGSVSGLVFSSSGTGNAATDANTEFTTTVAGTYTFTWNDSNLAITYPDVNGWMIEIDGVAVLLTDAVDGVYTYEVELKPSTDGHKIRVIDNTGATAVNYGNASTYTDETKYGGPPTVKPINMVADVAGLTLKTTGGIYEIKVNTATPTLQVKFVEEIDYDTPITVYFIKPDEWAAAYLHVIGSSTIEEKYPGYEMTHVEGNKYSFKVPTDATKIKFTDGSGEGAIPRTANIEMANVVEGRVFKVTGTPSNNSYSVVWE